MDLKVTKQRIAQSMQNELGFEFHIQTVISTILVLLSVSETSTYHGLEYLIQIIWYEQIFQLPTIIILIVSIAWRMLSCIRCYIKIIYLKRDFSTTKSFLTAVVFALVSIMIRILSYVLFLTPCLGLFGCLRHLQGEMYPHYNPYFSYVDLNDDFYFGNATTYKNSSYTTTHKWSQITRWTYLKPGEAESPGLEIYTILTIEHHFYLLFAMVLLNTVLLLRIKQGTNPAVFKTLSLIDVLMHAFGNCFIPHPMEDWDEGKGSVSDHQSRKRKVFKEMFASLLLNFAFNFMLLTPLVVLGVNIFERHTILIDTIGAFPEEIKAFEQIIFMIPFGYTSLMMLTLIQLLSYYLYNGKFHPFAIIVQPQCSEVKYLEYITYKDFTSESEC